MILKVCKQRIQDVNKELIQNVNKQLIMNRIAKCKQKHKQNC